MRGGFTKCPSTILSSIPVRGEMAVSCLAATEVYDDSGYFGPGLAAGTYLFCAEINETNGNLSEYCRPATVTLDWFEVISGLVINFPRTSAGRSRFPGASTRRTGRRQTS